MQSKVIAFNQSQRQESEAILGLRGGDVVKVHRKIKEGAKERIQIFEGMIIAIKGGQSASRTITVRKVSQGGYGVEIVVAVNSPMIEKIELVKRAKVRRSKLYFVRDKAAKALRFKFTDAKDIDLPLHNTKVEAADPSEADKDVAVGKQKSSSTAAAAASLNATVDPSVDGNVQTPIEKELGKDQDAKLKADV